MNPELLAKLRARQVASGLVPDEDEQPKKEVKKEAPKMTGDFSAAKKNLQAFFVQKQGGGSAASDVPPPPKEEIKGDAAGFANARKLLEQNMNQKAGGGSSSSGSGLPPPPSLGGLPPPPPPPSLSNLPPPPPPPSLSNLPPPPPPPSLGNLPPPPSLDSISSPPSQSKTSSRPPPPPPSYNEPPPSYNKPPPPPPSYNQPPPSYNRPPPPPPQQQKSQIYVPPPVNQPPPPSYNQPPIQQKPQVCVVAPPNHRPPPPPEQQQASSKQRTRKKSDQRHEREPIFNQMSGSKKTEKSEKKQQPREKIFGGKQHNISAEFFGNDIAGFIKKEFIRETDILQVIGTKVKKVQYHFNFPSIENGIRDIEPIETLYADGATLDVVSCYMQKNVNAIKPHNEAREQLISALRHYDWEKDPSRLKSIKEAADSVREKNIRYREPNFVQIKNGLNRCDNLIKSFLKYENYTACAEVKKIREDTDKLIALYCMQPEENDNLFDEIERKMLEIKNIKM